MDVVRFFPTWEKRQGLQGKLQSCHLGDGGQENSTAMFAILGTGFVPCVHREPYVQVDSRDWIHGQGTPMPSLRCGFGLVWPLVQAEGLGGHAAALAQLPLPPS